MALLFLAIIITASSQDIDAALVPVTRSLGADRLITLRRVMLPLALPVMITGDSTDTKVF